jgi:hypothetical protein
MLVDPGVSVRVESHTSRGLPGITANMVTRVMAEARTTADQTCHLPSSLISYSVFVSSTLGLLLPEDERSIQTWSTPGQLRGGVAPRDAAERQAFPDVSGALVQVAVD